MNGEISIEGLSKAAVLAALYNASQQQGMGFIHSRGQTDMTEAQAQTEIDARMQRLYFDYLHGRVMKVDISGNTPDPRLFDRDNWHGAAALAIRRLREGVAA